MQANNGQNRNHRAPDAVSLLKKDHRALRALLARLEKATHRAPDRRSELLGKIAREIRVHARIEEEIFYPAYQRSARSKEDEKLFFEASEEHALVDVVLPALEDEDPAGDVFGAKAKVLKDLIEHHAEEEEDEMFPRARKLLGAKRLTELGIELARRKRILKGAADRALAQPALVLHNDEGPRSSRKRPSRARSGKVGWLLLWLIGIPLPILLLLFLVRGCT